MRKDCSSLLYTVEFLLHNCKQIFCQTWRAFAWFYFLYLPFFPTFFFSILLIAVTSLIFLLRLNDVISWQINGFLEIHLLLIISHVFVSPYWFLDKNDCKVMLVEFIFVLACPSHFFNIKNYFKNRKIQCKN